MSDETIEQLEQAEGEARAVHQEAKAALDAAMIAALPFRVGDEVEVQFRGRNSAWEPAVIRSANPRFGGDYEASPRKNDGGWAKSVRHVYGETRKPAAVQS